MTKLKGFTVTKIEETSCTCHHSGCDCDSEAWGLVLVRDGIKSEIKTVEDSKGIWTYYDKEGKEIHVSHIGDVEFSDIYACMQD